ncbi:MAG: aminopeptidase [Deltaproteobacteria bacterium]|nr:aminopeptidase [Deltaproteobacteria bacterium]MBW2308649.1 aminopeptidase [Deltaproteobacteria bacterium]
MKHILMMRGARTLVDMCTKIKAGENVLVVTDFEKFEIAEVVAAAANERGGEVTIAIMTPRKADSAEPPPSVAEAMKKSDVIFTPVLKSITHTQAVKNAAAAGARILVMTHFTPEIMISGGIEADFEAQKLVCQNVARTLEQGKHLHLTTQKGTNLTANIEGRRGNALYCIVEPGEFSTVPTIEANVSPVEGSAEGVIVADASIPYLGIGVLREPVTLTVKKGMITSIDGGDQARVLAENLKSLGDPNVYNIAEVGIGLNPKSRMTGIMLDDEGVFGSVHIGIGTNITLGGTLKTACHYDALQWRGTIEVDGRLILENGQLKI